MQQNINDIEFIWEWNLELFSACIDPTDTVDSLHLFQYIRFREIKTAHLFWKTITLTFHTGRMNSNVISLMNNFTVWQSY